MSDAVRPGYLRLREAPDPIQVDQSAGHAVQSAPRSTPAMVRRANRPVPTDTPQRSTGRPLAATDPRWVLAVRVSDALEGPILRPTRRERLIRIGRTLGLSPFESNLIIAVVQDQARRGGQLHDAAGSLAMLRHPQQASPARRTGGWRLLSWVCAALAIELIVLWWWLG